jgi:hypothetical protein
MASTSRRQLNPFLERVSNGFWQLYSFCDNLQLAWATLSSFWCHLVILFTISMSSWKCWFADPEIPESRLLYLSTKRRFVPVWTSLDRDFGVCWFVKHLANWLQKIIASKKNPTHRIIACYHLLLSSLKLVTKDHSIPENPTHRIIDS